MKSRLFIALEIPDCIIEKIEGALRKECKKYNSFRWEKKEKLHFTIKFLGDVENKLIPDIKRIICETAGGFKPFSVDFKKFGFFYRNRKPAVLWVGIKNNPDMIKIFQELEEKLFEIGFEKEKRKFIPHLTLLRIKEENKFELLNNFFNLSVEDLSYQSGYISLIKSTLRREGSEYQTLERIKII